MKNNRGQALVEFIIIFPVFAFLIICMIDFSNLFYQKYQLENEIDYVCDLYLEKKENDMIGYASRKKFEVDYQKTGGSVRITLKRKVPISTPGLNKILHSPYEITVERVIYEQ